MSDPQAELQAFEAEVRAALTTAADELALERLESQYLGRKGKLRDFTAQIGRVAPDQRGPFGQAINAVKDRLTAVLTERRGALKASAPAEDTAFDLTLPGPARRPGHEHPIYRTLRELKMIFARLGFAVASGPEIETEFNNFEALNVPADHPARDGLDTFYVQGGTDPRLLRSHTSPVQIRTMLARKPPVRIVCPGKVFRPDAVDATHAAVFHQIEGLMVDEKVTFADLKGVLTLFAKAWFGESATTRFGPSYYPFTEPSADMEVSCVFCAQKGCAVCRDSGWIEILGSGMVHPKVFQAVGYDPQRVSGFAFGMGVERLAMLRFGINDIRLFTENHPAFLQQFR